MEIQAAKRMRLTNLHDSNKYFILQFEQLSSVKSLIDITRDVLDRVYLRLRHGSEKDQVVVVLDTIDKNHVCIIQAELPCKGIISESDIGFCLDTQVLHECLDKVENNLALQIYADKGSSSVTIVSYDALTNAESFHFDLKTLNEESNSVPLEDFLYEYQCDLNLQTFKKILGVAKGLKCRNLKMALYSRLEGTMTHAVTQFSGAGDSADFYRSFASSVVSEDDDATTEDTSLSSVENVSLGEIVNMKFEYAASFSLEYLSSFVKSMQQQCVTLRFVAPVSEGSEDEERPSNPLIIRYPLGIPGAFIRFILAPKTGD